MNPIRSALFATLLSVGGLPCVAQGIPESTPAALSPNAVDTAQSPPAKAAAAPAPRRDRSVILEDEIRERTETDAYTLIRAVRPFWLRVRGRSSMALPEAVQVYVNGMQVSGVTALQGVQTASIARIEHLDGGRATERYGAEHGAGAIMVTTR